MGVIGIADRCKILHHSHKSRLWNAKHCIEFPSIKDRNQWWHVEIVAINTWQRLSMMKMHPRWSWQNFVDKTYQPKTRRGSARNNITSHYQRNSPSKRTPPPALRQDRSIREPAIHHQVSKSRRSKVRLASRKHRLGRNGHSFSKEEMTISLFVLFCTKCSHQSISQLRILATHQRIHRGRNLRTHCTNSTDQSRRDTRQKSKEARMVSKRHQHNRRWSLRSIQFWESIQGTKASMGSSDRKGRHHGDQHIQHHRQTSAKSASGSNLPKNIEIAATQKRPRKK